jgi:Peptidase inhibitor I78 family
MRRALVLLVLTGCTPASSDDLYMPPTIEDLTTCGADALQGLVGQPRAVLAGMRFSQPVVVLDPDTPVPADLVPERLSIELLNYDTITRVSCG